MPGIGQSVASARSGNQQRAAKALPPPPTPKASTTTGANPRGVAITAPAPKPTVNDTAAKTLSTGANPRGTAIAQRPQAPTKNDLKAVWDVFNHQDQPTQTKIVQRALKTPSPEGNLVLAAIKAHVPKGSHLNLMAGTGKSVNAGPSLFDALGKIFSPKSVYGSKGAAGSTNTGGMLGTVTPFGGKKGAEQVLTNIGKDAIDLPAQTFSTVGTLGGDVVKGKLGKAASDLVKPYEQLLAHPSQSFYQHPLDSYLMAAGAVHGLTRLGAGAVRATAPESALGRKLSTAREPVQLNANQAVPRPRYSPYPLIKAGQVGLEKVRYKRGPTGALEPKSADLHAKLTGMETSRQVGLNNRLRVEHRDQAIAARMASVRPSVAERGANAAKTSLKRGPQHAIIPGAEVLARIADTTIRKPSTFAADLVKHIKQVSANRANLLDRQDLLKEHDAYVNALNEMANRKLTKPQLERVFKAADEYAKDYRPVQGEAQGFGQFGSRPEEALLRRELGHYAITHMDARYDPERGLVDAEGKPLSTQDIIDHIKGPEGTGGRMPAFTSDRAKAGSAFYISNERRPLPEGAKNTYFAYTHGLTDPSHEALLEQHVRMQGIVDAHKAQNRLVNQNVVMKEDGKPWPSFHAANNDAPAGYVPIALSQPFHPLESLDKALEGTSPMTIEEEAQAHGLDLNSRLTDHGQGRWGLIDKTVLQRIKEHEGQIQSTPTMRAFKMGNNQFRQVALSTSAKHIPGILTENLIRSAADAEGIMSWITAHRLLKRAEELNPEAGRTARTQLTGGTVAGSAKMMMTRQVSDRFAGTNLARPLRAWESVMRTPGPRQIRTAWRAWVHLAINGTKHVIEEEFQKASLGKALLREFGSEHGPFFKALRLQGGMLDDMARGVVDEKKVRQWRAEVEKIRGRWTDLTPSGQTAMMMTPFGLWWLNSAKWLVRSPIDRPLQTAALAAATVGTEKERKQRGMDLFAPNAVPLYMQGGIPLGGNSILAQNYYSPFGIANDPLQTAGSLVEPTVAPLLLGSLGLNYLGKPLNSPGNPHGDTPANVGERLAYIANSLTGLFLPLYTKAEQIAEGGASAYDSSNLFNTQTKTPGQGPVAGLKKAFFPARLYHNKPVASAAQSNTFSIPKQSANASGGQWNVVHMNPQGTGATGTTWKVTP